MNNKINLYWALLAVTPGAFSPVSSIAAAATGSTLDLTQHWVGYISVSIFVFT